MTQVDTTVSNRVLAKDNPFMVQRTDAVPFDFMETDFGNIEAFAKHVQTCKFRGAILGGHGRGKTTLLCDLSVWLCDQKIDCELVFLPRERDLQPAAVKKTVRRALSGAIVLLDGLERLPLIARQRLVSRSKTFSGFIATTHRRSGLRTLIRCRTSERTLMAVLDSLDMNRPEVRAAGISLLAKHDGNMRFALRELYDQYADGQLQCFGS